MAYLCFSMWDLSSEDLKRLGGFEQLGWEIYILDCFFTHISGTLAEGWAQLGLLTRVSARATPSWRRQYDQTSEVVQRFRKDRSCLSFMT